MTVVNPTRTDAFAVTVDDTMPVREGEWDGARGEREIFDWATSKDGQVDWAKAAKGFILADLDPPEGEDITRASFKLPIAYVERVQILALGVNRANRPLPHLQRHAQLRSGAQP